MMFSRSTIKYHDKVIVQTIVDHDGPWSNMVPWSTMVWTVALSWYLMVDHEKHGRLYKKKTVVNMVIHGHRFGRSLNFNFIEKLRKEKYMAVC